MDEVKLNKNLVKEMANYVADGCDMDRAAILAGVDPSQLHEWLELAEDKNCKAIYAILAFELKRADAEFEHNHIQNVSLAGDEGDWKASANLLRNKYPTRWNRDNDKQNETNNEFTIRIITPDEAGE